MVQAIDLRSAIFDYLSGNYSFNEFENWMIASTRGINKWGDVETRHLAYSIDLRIAEYLVSESGKITEKDLRSELSVLANTYFPSPGAVFITSGTSTQATMQPLGLQTPLVDRRFVGAYESPVPR